MILHADEPGVLGNLQRLEVSAECRAGFLVAHEQVKCFLQVVDCFNQVSVVYVAEGQGDEDEPVVVLNHVHDLRDLRIDLQRAPPAAQGAEPVLAEGCLIQEGLLSEVSRDGEPEEGSAVSDFLCALPVSQFHHQPAELLGVCSMDLKVIVEFGLNAIRSFSEFPFKLKFFGILLYVLVLFPHGIPL